MPYPESCPECGSQFRNTGTHFTARRNEVDRHVLLELGCQNTNRRYWWDFTAGHLAGETAPAKQLVGAATTSSVSTNGNGHVAVPALKLEDAPATPPPALELEPMTTNGHEVEQPPAASKDALKDAFVRQLQLDRMTLRQMRSLLMSDEARRSIEVAVGATEATYERLALILFGIDLPQLLGKSAIPPAAPAMSAEERLELQREKARIRARLRRAAIKAAKQPAT
jgi:hypothetical protein